MDAGPDVRGAGGSDPDANPMDAGPAGSDPDFGVMGINFVPVETVTDAGQTVSHMALTGILKMPHDHGVLVWEKFGRIVHYTIEGDRFVFQGEVRLPDVYIERGDCGLISVALDPGWEQNGMLYAGHCISLTHSAVTRFEFHDDDYASVAATAKRVIEFGDERAQQGWHNVGAIGFFDDPEGSMWILAGEKALSDNAQDLTDDLGSVLRVIPDRERSGSGYRPHPDNPFAGSNPTSTSSPNIYAWGLRSPWRAFIDRKNRIWIGDVGKRNEEINLLSTVGQNFGWGDADGPCPAGDPVCATFTDPLASWNRNRTHRYRTEDPEASGQNSRCVQVAGQYVADDHDVYDGLLDDAALAGDMCVGNVRAFVIDDDGALVRDQHVGHLVGITGMMQGDDGYLYLTSFGSCSSSTLGFGGIYRAVPKYSETKPDESMKPEAPLVESPLGPMPRLLSETGIFADSSLTEPIARAVRYEPTLALWSDGLGKQRWMVLPPGTQVDNSNRGAWQFPVGTLFFKTFTYLDATGVVVPMETRIIRRTATGWDYNGYLWRGDDADLLSLEVPLALSVEGAAEYTVHEIPSRVDCHSCHDSNDTVVIGFDELRLNGPRTGESVSQLAEFESLGIFTQSLPLAPEAIMESEATAAQVVGYLHGNCAHCHNRSPGAQSVLSLEHEESVANLINQPVEGHGQAQGIRVVPGDPAASVLFQAFSGESASDEVQPMPPLGVMMRDTETVELLRTWITTLPIQ